MPSPSRDSGMATLERALAAFVAWQERDPREPADEFLAAHADLEDLLRPMVHGDADPVADEPGADGERMLGKYRVRRELGRGGMGVVYEADDTELGRTVALKVLPAHLTLSPTSIARFQREANLAAQLDHHGIVSVYGTGQADGHHFFAMELLRGVPLDELLDAIRGDERDGAVRAALQRHATTTGQETTDIDLGGKRTTVMVRIAHRLAEALAYAHAHGVLHRDVKPSNVIVNPSGRVVLTDFGLARQGDAPGVTRTGMFAGTPHYASPEQTLGDWDRVGPPSDVFSLGATLYEMLVDRLPFDGPDVERAIRERDPAPIDRAHGIPPDLAAIVHKALEKDPVRRYASALEFGNDLLAWLEHRPVSARRASAWDRTMRWVRREPLRAALAAVLVLGIPLLAGLGGYLAANIDTIAVGEATLERARISDALDHAFQDLSNGHYGQAMAGFESVVAAHGPDPEALAGQLLVLGQLLDSRPLDVFLDRHREVVAARSALRALVDEMQHGEHRASLWLGERDSWSPSDYAIAGHFCAARARASNDPAWSGRAVRMFHQAALGSRRLHHVCAWARAADRAADDASVTAAVECLHRFFPDRVTALLTIAEVCARTDAAVAADAIERARAFEPDHPFVARWIAKHEADGPHDLAKRYDAILARFPGASSVLVDRAELAVDAGDLDLAKQLLDRVAEIETAALGLDAWLAAADPDPKPFHAPFSAKPNDVVTRAAIEFAKLGRPDDAAELLAAARGLRAWAGEPVAGLAQAALHAGYPATARELVDDRIAAGDAPALVWLVRAKIATVEEDDELALEATARAIALEPNNPDAAYVRAVTLYNMRRFDDAVAPISVAIDARPTDASFSRTLRDIHTARRDLTGVITEAERLATALFDAGDPAAAADVLAPYRQMPPEHILPGAERIGARVHASIQRYREAAGTAR